MSASIAAVDGHTRNAREANASLSLLSVNLWNGRVPAAALAALVARVRPDVVLTQEMTPEHADALTAFLPHGSLEPARDTSGMGIAARLPVEIARVSLPRRDARVARLVATAWPAFARGIEIVNVHLSAPTELRRFRERGDQLGRLERHLDQHPHPMRIVAGDFNSFPAMPVYRRLRGRFRDLVEDHARRHGRLPGATWAPLPWITPLFRIDHVMAVGVEARTVTLHRLPGGDHSAIEVTLVAKWASGVDVVR